MLELIILLDALLAAHWSQDVSPYRRDIFVIELHVSFEISFYTVVSVVDQFEERNHDLFPGIRASQLHVRDRRLGTYREVNIFRALSLSDAKNGIMVNRAMIFSRAGSRPIRVSA